MEVNSNSTKDKEKTAAHGVFFFNKELLENTVDPSLSTGDIVPREKMHNYEK